MANKLRLDRVVMVWQGETKDLDELRIKLKGLPGHEVWSVEKYDDISELTVVIPQEGGCQ